MSGRPSRLAAPARLALQAAAAAAPAGSTSRITPRAGCFRHASSASTSSQYNVPTPPRSSPSTFKYKRADNGWREEIIALEPLKSALRAKDGAEAWTAWAELRESGKQSGLKSEGQRELLMLFHQDQAKLVALAMNHAEDSQLPALIDCLRHLTIMGQHKSVLDITSAALTWERQTTMLRAKQRGIWLSHLVSFAAIACANLPNASVKPLIELVMPLAPLRADLAKDTAAFVSNGTPLSPARAVQIFKDVKLTSTTAKVPMDYYRHAMLAWGLKYNSPTQKTEGNALARRIEYLSTVSNFNAIQTLLSTAMEARTDEFDQWLSVSVSHDLEADWNDMTWSSILSSSLAKKKRELANEAWKAYSGLKPANEPPSNRIWIALLRGYGESCEWESMGKTWEQMRAGGQSADSHAYTTMIAAYFRARLSNEALLLYEQVKSDAATQKAELPPETVSAVLHGLLHNDRREEADQLYRMMRTGEGGLPKPNISTINTLLRAQGRPGDFGKIIETLQTAVEFNLEPDVVTFTTVLDAFSRVNREDAVQQVYELMQSTGIKASSVTLSTLIRDALETDETTSEVADFNLALGLLHKMETQGPSPTAVSYTKIISALFYHHQQFTRLYREGKLHAPHMTMLSKQSGRHSDGLLLSQHRPEAGLAVMMMDQMKARGPEPNRVTYHTIISGLLVSRGNDESEAARKVNMVCLQRAMKLLEELCAGARPNEDTWVLVLQRLMTHCRCNDPQRAKKAQAFLASTMARIKRLGLPMEGALMRAMDDGESLCRIL